MVLTTIAPPASPQQGAPPPLAAAAAPPTMAVANAALRSGFVLLPRTILHAAGLSRDAKLLYAVLLSYAWQEGSCFPGYERLMEDLQCSINSMTAYMQELERAGLISRRRRGLGKTNVYTIRDLPAAARAEASQSPNSCESGLTTAVKPAPQKLRPQHDSARKDSAEQQQPTPPITVVPAESALTGIAGDADVVALLLAQGVTKRVALDLATKHPANAIRQQLDWHRYRPTVKTNPAGALVRAIRDEWAPPAAWVERQERQAAIARQVEEERQRAAEEQEHRRRQAALSPEERIAGRLEYWLTRQRVLRRREPTLEEIAAQRAELIATLEPVASGA